MEISDGSLGMVLTNVIFISSLQRIILTSQTDPVLLSVSQPGSEKCSIIEEPREDRMKEREGVM